jgi:site-specific recombinase XerD
MARLSAVPDQPAHDPDPVPADWRDLRASFVLALRAARRSPATVATYTDGCDQFARFLHEHAPGRLIEQATRDDLRGFLVDLEDRGRAPGTVAARHRALRALYKFLKAEEIIETDPMRAIPSPTVTQERIPPALTVEQIDAIVAKCRPKSTFTGSRDRALILLLSSSGLRSGECLALTEADLHLDVDEPYVTVRHGKGDKAREAAVSFEAAAAIQSYLRQRRKHAARHRPELWLSRAHHALTASGLLQVVHDAGARVGLDVHVHSLRHSAAHQMLFDKGMQEHDVAFQLGHKGTKQLARYGAARAAERSRSAFFRQDR